MTVASLESASIPTGLASKGWLSLGGRLLLASIFIVAGFRKIADADAFTAYMTSYGVPALLLPLATALELGAGLLLTLGAWTRWAALTLLGYTVILALIFHAFWAVDPKQFQAQLNLFLFHAETIGGLLYIAAYGAGALSIDRLRAERHGR